MAAEQGSKVSFHCDKKFSWEHNTRNFDKDKWNKDGHIHPERSHLNSYLIDHIAPNKWNKWCEDTFGKAIDDFNEKNRKRNPDRVIDKKAKYREYYKKVQESVIQIGNEEFNPLSNEEHLAFLHNVIEHWQKDNPTLKVVGAYIHMDETTPHLHLDWLPVAHSTRGLSVKVSMDGALKDMGIGRAKNQKYDERPYSRFLVQERAKLEDIGREYTEIIEAEHGKIKTHTEYYEHQGKEKIKKIKQEQKVAEQEKELAEQKAAQMQELADIEEGRLKTLTRKSEEKEEKVESLTKEVENLSDLKEELGEDLESMKDELEWAKRRKADTEKNLENLGATVDVRTRTNQIIDNINQCADTDIDIVDTTEEKKIFGKVKPATVTITKESFDKLVAESKGVYQLNYINNQIWDNLGKMEKYAERIHTSDIERAKMAKDELSGQLMDTVIDLQYENGYLKKENKELKEWKSQTSNYYELRDEVFSLRKLVKKLEKTIEKVKEVVKAALKHMLGIEYQDGSTALEKFIDENDLKEEQIELVRDMSDELKEEQEQGHDSQEWGWDDFSL